MDTDYSDIINLPRPVSKDHPEIPMEKRAMQFSSFDALDGLDDDISYAEREMFRKFEELTKEIALQQENKDESGSN